MITKIFRGKNRAVKFQIRKMLYKCYRKFNILTHTFFYITKECIYRCTNVIRENFACKNKMKILQLIYALYYSYTFITGSKELPKHIIIYIA